MQDLRDENVPSGQALIPAFSVRREGLSQSLR